METDPTGSASDAPPPPPALPRAGSSTSDSGGPKVRKKRLGVDPSLIISEERSKRRRTPSPGLGQGHEPGTEHVQQERDPRDPVRAKELGMIIYNRIITSKDSEGEDMSHVFVKLPNKRNFPDYYETIKHPMSLEIVHAKLEASEYNTLKDVCSDLGQIFNNAKRYNVKESLIFQYAKKLHKMTRVYYTTTTSPDKAKDESDSEAEHDDDDIAPLRGQSMQHSVSAEGYNDQADAEGEVDAEGELDEDGEGEAVQGQEPAEAYPSSNSGQAGSDGAGGREIKRRGNYMKDGPSVYKLIKPVLKAIKDAKAKDGSGREVAAMFVKLPERKDLPDYYKTINKPISLEEIEFKQVSRRYETWQEFFSDIELMCSNAMEYNEDESEVYQDARQIKELLVKNRNDVLARIANPNAPRYVRTRPYPNATSSRSSTQSGPSYPRSPNMGMYTQSPGQGYMPSPMPYSPASQPMRINQGPNQALTPNSSLYPNYPGSVPGLGPGLGLGPGSVPSPSIPRQYLPALPQGVVNEEIVSTLGRYPLYEQQAWAQSLAPAALAMYRTIVANNEVRKMMGMQQMNTMAMPPTPIPSPSPYPYARPPLPASHAPSPASLPRQPSYPDPSSARQYGSGNGAGASFSHGNYPPMPSHPTSAPSPSPAPAPPPIPAPASQMRPKTLAPEKPKPPIPTIRYLDLMFSSPGEPVHFRKALRLRNLRGVVTHSIVLDSKTSEFELTAYIDDPSSSSSTAMLKTNSNGSSATATDGVYGLGNQPVTVPEVSLRVNDRQASLPHFVYAAPRPNRAPSANGTTLDDEPSTNPIATEPNPSSHPTASGSGDNLESKPRGMKWNFHIATNKYSSKVELVATKPGSLAETVTIYINRQY